MSEYDAKRQRAKEARRQRARYRIRKRIVGSAERPRLAVFKSNRFVYAQLIDDTAGVTLAQANSAEADIKSDVEGSPSTVEAANSVGKVIAERAKEKGIETVVFDRGGYVYHGRIKAVADGAREQGLRL